MVIDKIYFERIACWEQRYTSDYDVRSRFILRIYLFRVIVIFLQQLLPFSRYETRFGWEAFYIWTQKLDASVLPIIKSYLI